MRCVVSAAEGPGPVSLLQSRKKKKNADPDLCASGEGGEVGIGVTPEEVTPPFPSRGLDEAPLVDSGLQSMEAAVSDCGFPSSVAVGGFHKS